MAHYCWKDIGNIFFHHHAEQGLRKKKNLIRKVGSGVGEHLFFIHAVSASPTFNASEGCT